MRGIVIFAELVMTRVRSFLWGAEFQAEPWNLPFFMEF